MTTDRAWSSVAAGVVLTRIGRVVEGSGVLATLDGESVELSGFRHAV